MQGHNNFTIIQSALDGMSLGGGHTHKPYYFYYDHKNDRFCEYGGINISIDELQQYQNAEKIITLIKGNNGAITSILKRSNDIININYSVPEHTGLQDLDWNYYITLKIKNDSLWISSEGEGIYLPALVPEIAKYD